MLVISTDIGKDLCNQAPPLEQNTCNFIWLKQKVVAELLSHIKKTTLGA